MLQKLFSAVPASSSRAGVGCASIVVVAVLGRIAANSIAETRFSLVQFVSETKNEHG
jgi:hypothetical protein